MSVIKPTNDLCSLRYGIGFKKSPSQTGYRTQKRKMTFVSQSNAMPCDIALKFNRNN